MHDERTAEIWLARAEPGTRTPSSAGNRPLLVVRRPSHYRGTQIQTSTLRRVARSSDGTVTPSNVYKKSSGFEATLRSLNKGTQIRWRKNLCSPCNNARSQPFDRAYDAFEAFVVQHIDVVSKLYRLNWAVVYGSGWQEQARNLARYFGKQLGCMMASYQLPVPSELKEFINGTDRCPSIWFALFINPRGVDFHACMLQDGNKDGLSTYVGLLESNAYQNEGVLSGIDYGYHIGYVWLLAQWRSDAEVASWWEHIVIDLPRLTEE